MVLETWGDQFKATGKASREDLEKWREYFQRYGKHDDARALEDTIKEMRRRGIEFADFEITGRGDYTSPSHVKNISDIKIDAGIQASAVAESTTGKKYGEQDIDIKQFKRGQDIQVGNDVLVAMITNNAGIIASGYRDVLEGTGPTIGGTILVDKMAEMLGGYRKISQVLQDSVRMKGSIGLKLAKVLGISAEVGTAKEAMEKIDANTLKLKMMEYYINEISRNPDVNWKAKELTEIGHELYNLMKKHGEMSTIQQLTSSVPNPLKGKHVKKKS